MDGNELKRRFGQRIQMFRRQRNMTQEQLAEAIGKSTDTVSNIETGRLSTRIENAMKLADALGVPLAELFNFDPIAPPANKEHRLAVERLINLVEPLSPQGIDTVRRAFELILELSKSSYSDLEQNAHQQK